MGFGAIFAPPKAAKTHLKKLRQKNYRDAYVAEHVRHDFLVHSLQGSLC
jgi:hypothetical protein